MQKRLPIHAGDLSRDVVHDMLVGMSRNGAIILKTCLKMYDLPDSRIKWRRILVAAGCARNNVVGNGIRWVTGVEPTTDLAEEVCRRYEGTYLPPEPEAAPEGPAAKTPLERIEWKLDRIMAVMHLDADTMQEA